MGTSSRLTFIVTIYCSGRRWRLHRATSYQGSSRCSGQGIVLCGIAGEYGVEDADVQVALLASVLLHRDLDPTRFPVDVTDVQDSAAELTGKLGRSTEKATIATAARAVQKLGGTLYSLSREFGSEQQPQRKNRVTKKLPLVGVVGRFLGERTALGDIARAGSEWLQAKGHAQDWRPQM